MPPTHRPWSWEISHVRRSSIPAWEKISPKSTLSKNLTEQLGRPLIDEEAAAPQKESFCYNIVDHLSRVPAKVSLLDLIKMDKKCFKYTDSNLTVRRQFVDKKPIQGARVYCSDAALYEEEEQRLDTPLKQQETGVANGSRRDILQIIEKQFELINGVETSSLVAECDIET
ncbi:hypothetical protein AAC387_Pa02g1963 [Persea americana]